MWLCYFCAACLSVVNVLVLTYIQAVTSCDVNVSSIFGDLFKPALEVTSVLNWV